MENKSTSNTINKFTERLLLGTIIIFSPLIFSSLLGVLFKGEKIKDKAHLETLLEQEKKNLGIENKNIHAYFCDTIEDSLSKKINKNSYEILLSNNQRKLGILKHELYHIADGHCDENYKLLNEGRKLENTLRYLFVNEPKALIYGATGIKF